MSEDQVPHASAARAQLEKLAAELKAEQAKAAVEQPVQGTSAEGPTLFGLTPGGLFASLIVSVLGLAYLKFARSTGEPVIAVLGLVLLAVPFFVTHTWALVGVGVLVPLLTFALRRFIRY